MSTMHSNFGLAALITVIFLNNNIETATPGTMANMIMQDILSSQFLNSQLGSLIHGLSSSHVSHPSLHFRHSKSVYEFASP